MHDMYELSTTVEIYKDHYMTLLTIEKALSTTVEIYKDHYILITKNQTNFSFSASLFLHIIYNKS